MYITRNIESVIEKRLVNRSAVLLSGARQTGKSTLLQHCFTDYQYVSLDLPAISFEAKNQTEQFLRRHPAPLIIDEVQYAPEIFRYLKSVIDQTRQQNGQYILTGSQQFRLMSHVTDSLAGRISLIDLYPLSLRELESWSKKCAAGERLLTWMLKGGYPEIHSKDIPPVEFYEDYLATYLERDVRQLLQVKNLGVFHQFILLLALRSGHVVNYNELATTIGTTIKTIKSWISVLQTSNIIFLVKPYFENLSKRMVKAPKLYFLDTGLLCHLLAIRTTETLLETPLKGYIFETLMISEFLKQLNEKGLPKEIYYYRDYQGNEVDLIYPEAGKLNLYECKWAYQQACYPANVKKVISIIGSDKVGKITTVTTDREKRFVAENHVLSNVLEF
jgi:uncharacterized protein